MSRCTKCGATIKPRSDFCEYCGAYVDATEVESVLRFDEARDIREKQAAEAAREHEAELERYRDGQKWKQTLLLFGAVALLFVAIGWMAYQEERDTVEMPAASKDFKGDDYRAVRTDLRTAGFTSVDTTAVPDLKTGWINQPGEVKEVSVNGHTDWESGSRFPSDAGIVIRYHVFPDKQ